MIIIRVIIPRLFVIAIPGRDENDLSYLCVCWQRDRLGNRLKIVNLYIDFFLNLKKWRCPH